VRLNRLPVSGYRGCLSPITIEDKSMAQLHLSDPSVDLLQILRDVYEHAGGDQSEPLEAFVGDSLLSSTRNVLDLSSTAIATEPAAGCM
jgi:hypothetical protein